VLLAGLEISDRLVVELAQCLRMEGLDDAAETLEDACDDVRGIVALTDADREAILKALSYCPYGLSELRGVLLLEHEWRRTEGLVSHAPLVG
jgi:hypothetical protein